MRFKGQKAFCFLVVGLVLILGAIANPAGITGSVSDRGRFFIMLAVFIAGLFSCWKGWTSLSSLKKETPDLTWWQLLKTDLIAVGLIVLFFTGIWLLPEATRERITKTLQEFVEMSHVIKGGAP
jgi:hypothetical protein